MTSYDWFIRLSRPYDEIKDWVEWIPAEKKCAVEHTADEEVSRTHTHILVVGCSLQKLSVKTKLERMVGKFSKGDWAFTLPEDDNWEKMCVYMSKGTIDYSLMWGFEFDWTDIKSKWIEKNCHPKKPGTLNHFVIKENHEQSRKRQCELIDEIKSELSKKYGNEQWHPRDVLATIRDVVIDKHKTVIGRYKVRDYYDTIMATHPQGKTVWLDQLEYFVGYRT